MNNVKTLLKIAANTNTCTCAHDYRVETAERHTETSRRYNTSTENSDIHSEAQQLQC